MTELSRVTEIIAEYRLDAEQTTGGAALRRLAEAFAAAERAARQTPERDSEGLERDPLQVAEEAASEWTAVHGLADDFDHFVRAICRYECGMREFGPAWDAEFHDESRDEHRAAAVGILNALSEPRRPLRRRRPSHD